MVYVIILIGIVKTLAVKNKIVIHKLKNGFFEMDLRTLML